MKTTKKKDKDFAGLNSSSNSEVIDTAGNVDSN
jgi:hypothetical protein